MKKATLLLTLVSILMVSCAKDDLRHSQDYAGIFPTFYASLGDETDADTKTYIDSKMKLRWTKGDSLSIFVGNTYNHKYKFDGETGASNGSFSAISNPEFVSAEPLDANYAVYPYNASNEMNPDGSMSVILPSVQKYAQNSFGLGANTMVATTENKQDKFLQFKNLCGYVVVKLYGTGTVMSVKLEGNNGEKISGKAYVQAAFGTFPSVTMSEEAITSITLDCEEGVTLGTTAETAAEFWFCVPPVTFSKGFSIKAISASGEVLERRISSSKTIDRNTINSLSALKAEFSSALIPIPEQVDLGLSVKWSNFNLGSSSPEEYGDYYQWAGTENVTDTSIYLHFDICPYHIPRSLYDTGWIKYIPSDKPSYWFSNKSPDNKTTLDPEDDVAHVKLGDNWRTPTRAEWEELQVNCTWTLTTLNGVNGYKVKSNKPGYSDNNIFIPMAGMRNNDVLESSGYEGWYWSSDLYEVVPYLAWAFHIENLLVCSNSGSARCNGLSVRPVSE